MRDQQINIFNKLFLCLILFSLMMMSVSVSHAESYTLVTKWGSDGITDGKFSLPTAVTVDSEGNVYVADMNNNRIQKFNSTGGFITKWGSEGTSDGQFSYPFGVAVDSAGNVYVADVVNYRVQKFNSTGGFITKWGSEGDGDGQFEILFGVAVDSAGNVYVTEKNNNRIQKFNSTGGFITKWGSEGDGNGQFQNPGGVAVDSEGNVYVADTENNRIQKFNSTGGFITKWGSEGTSDGLRFPSGVAVDSSGSVFVADNGNNRIQKFNSTGGFITKWGPSGIENGGFNAPVGVAVDSFDNVYVADTGNNRISKFALFPTANFSTNITSGYAPLSVQFTDLSEDETGWYWDFGDGNNSNQTNPVHTYFTAGNYTINLTASNANGIDSKLASITVLEPVFPVANFSANVTSGVVPLSVQFNDSSENTTGWYWDFGDGANSNEQNPVHMFSAAGNYTVNLTASNTNGTDSINATIAVQKATPEITWNDPEDIVYGIPLSSTQLNASASVNGTLDYTPATGTVLGVGHHTLQVDFAPDDAANYTNASANVSINVTSGTPAITWSNPVDIVYGTALNSTQLNALASVPGNFTYDPATGTILDAGQHSLHLDFTPTDTANYTNTSENVTINVLQAVPEITWNNPADIMYGTALNSTQLNALASINGTFVYNPTNSTVLAVGQHTLQAEFTPEDAVNYTNASKNVTINVSAQPVLPVANFSTNITEGYAPLSVQFNDSSINANEWHWDFGDGNSSTDMNPVHIYATSGNYTVNLTASNGNGTSLTNATAIITVLNPLSYSVDETVTNVSKEVTDGNVTASGDVITYWINLTNNGNINLSNVSVRISNPPLNITRSNSSVNDDEILNVGETWTYLVNYTVTQADINNDGTEGDGFIENTVTFDCDELEPQSYSVQVPIERSPKYEIFKSVIGPDENGDCIINSAGDKIPYRIVVKDEGNVDLTNITVNDSLINLTGPIGNGTEENVLHPGEIWEYTGTYTLTSVDINNGTGYINNTATVGCDQLPERNSSVNTPIDRNADLSIYKSVTGIDEAGDHIINEVGDIIQYQVAVKNNGNIDLTGVSVIDLMVNLTKTTGDHVDPDVLDPGETWIYAGNYTVTQQDINRSKEGDSIIENTATVSCNQLSNESSSLVLPITYIPPIVITPEPENSTDYPIANFSANVTEGYAPLSIKFTDHSQNATGWSWDFNNDGSSESNETNPIYTYNNPGTYTVNLAVRNTNGTDSMNTTINVQQVTNSNSGGSSGGSNGGSVYSSGGSSRSSTVTNDTNNTTSKITQIETITPTVAPNTTPASIESTPLQIATSNTTKQKTPGFEIISAVTALLAVLLFRRR
jgi:trimeric autotransporter adhesin